MTATETSTAAVHAKARRRKRLAALVLVALVGLIAWGGYDALIASHEESTDNAYVQGNIVQITPQVGGTVMAILADDNDFVHAGAPLVRLDPADTQVALHQAEAALAQTVRQVRQLYANNATLAAQVTLRESEVASADALQAQARTSLERAEQDVQRRLQLGASGAVSGEELKHAQSAVDTARTQLAAARAGQAAAKAGVAAARQQLASNQALTQGVQVGEHPSVQAAAAQLRQAWLAAHRTELPAPVDGYIARRSVQLGQRVAAGAPLMAVVPLKGVWVDANFKETQLRNLRLGQRATLTADLYGSQVRYTGTVAGLGVGTGAAFALLPPQNATGNWIKVVQRIPVRIALDPEPLARHPLRLGLSMQVTVDTREHGGAAPTTAARTEPLAETSVYALQDGDADTEIARIIAANVGTP
ncbi:HlyD family efflux transporter periplasmic adaptor subunit [Comamonas sp. NLF-1-9]|uniref:HlyD family efflux transporter periplasmic adaptor subunit n=1 Tax=Comamonas sp. NLF-1-9 TaxID=2853163 RepID=UPI001C483FED|nr:HlyD family efflux transporter periplasmic adaptor subunit [Comamonas sp. NLF-1-9]QXL83699.1 HlyD family efflux transporter periplasmic adaptor subunit [Comamonas sp. NLF-1-9]